MDRMLRYDFEGDVRQIGEEPASIVRLSPNALRLTFPATGAVFDVTVHRPRSESKAARGEVRSFARDRQEERQDEQPAPPPAPTRRKRRTRAEIEAADRSAGH